MSGRNDDAISRMDRDAIKRFEVWIARQSNGRAQVRDLKQLSGGAIQENWWLKLDLEGGDWPGSHDLVLRKDAPSNVAVSHGRAEEFAILQAAHAAGVAVARALCALRRYRSSWDTFLFDASRFGNGSRT